MTVIVTVFDQFGCILAQDPVPAQDLGKVFRHVKAVFPAASRVRVDVEV